MAETITAPTQDSAATAFPEFEMPAVIEEKPSEPAAAEPSVAEPENPAPEASAPEPEQTDFKTLEKRFKDTQTALHTTSKEKKQLEVRLKKAADALLIQVESAGVELTEDEQQLAYDNPAELARVYAEKLEAKKQHAQEALELTPEEQQAIENEHKQIEEKRRLEEVTAAYKVVAAAHPDIDSVLSKENIDKYFTANDSKELQELETDQERFETAYQKMQARITGVEAAKQQMQAGPAIPAGPSLSDAGTANPGVEAATVSMDEAWKSNKL